MRSMERDTYRDTLLYALALAGSKRALARHLRVAVRQLDSWLSGADGVPDAVFHAALDLVIDSSPLAIFRSRRLLQAIAR